MDRACAGTSHRGRNFLADDPGFAHAENDDLAFDSRQQIDNVFDVVGVKAGRTASYGLGFQTQEFKHVGKIIFVTHLIMVPAAGVEPATFRSGGERSNPLSYAGMVEENKDITRCRTLAK